jgi:NADPH:quinone reductase-like Zn-dependent oxidoreductase
MCVPLPDTLDDATAAALANLAMSSWAALKFRAGLTAGEDVLILGATGIAGKLAVQVAKRLGANSVIAAGRNRQALEDLRSLGADAVVSLEPDPADTVTSLRAGWAKAPVDIVLDYLWGRPAELLFQAITQKGLQRAPKRVRYVQIGSSAGPTASLPASALRSTGLELLGSGFGSASIDRILKAVQELFQQAARQPFHFEVRTARLNEIEFRWREDGQRARLVFQPA